MRWLLALSVVLAALASVRAEPKKKLLLVGQGPDGLHPAATHEYLPGIRILEKLLKDVPGLEITVVRADDPWKDGPGLIERADGVVLFVAEGAKWIQADPKRHAALAKVARRGGGLAGLHWAIGTRDAAPIADFLKLFGGCHGGPDRKFKVVEVQAEPADHPSTAGIKPFAIKDEFYYKLKFAEGVKPVLRVPIDGEKETVAFAFERPDGGRSFGYSALHFHDAWKHPEVRRLVAQGVLWSLQLPIPRDGLPVAVQDADLELK